MTSGFFIIKANKVTFFWGGGGGKDILFFQRSQKVPFFTHYTYAHIIKYIYNFKSGNIIENRYFLISSNHGNNSQYALSVL